MSDQTDGDLKLTQRQLGHAPVATTVDLFVHRDEEEMRRAGETLAQIISCPPVAHLVTAVEERLH
jgi:hypothetical protein